MTGLSMSRDQANEGARPSDRRSAFAGFADAVRPRVERELVRILDEEAAISNDDGSTAALVGNVLRSVTMRGGKRLRPALLGVGFVAAGGSADDRAIDVAGAAFELLQSYLLIHDDWMDESVLRRGGPTAHVMLQGALGEASAEAGAILAGDYGCALSQRVMLEVPAPADRVLAASRMLAHVHSEVVRGQVIDMFERLDDEGAIEHGYALKTASYTVAGPLAIGALLAGGTEVAVLLGAIGRSVGVAFQLHDDLLGLFGDEKVTGKPVGTDLRDGKRTWLTAQFLRTARGRSLLSQVFGRKDAPADVVETVLFELRKEPAVDACRARIATLCEDACHRVDASSLSNGELLRGAIELLTERDA